MDYDVSILFTRDAEETAGMLYAFARRELGEAKSERSFHRHKSARSGREELEYILTAVPEVGPKAAREILSAFGTAEVSLRLRPGSPHAADTAGDRSMY